MAPTTPMLPQTPTATQTPASAPGFRDWLSSPQGRAAMLQFGVNMLQPISVGQTFGGHVGQAVGAGGEAAGRQASAEAGAQQQAFENRVKGEELDIKRQRVNKIGSSRSGLTLSQLLGRQDRQANALRTYLLKAAENATYVDPNMAGKTPDEIIADPAWRAAQVRAFELAQNPGAAGSGSLVGGEDELPDGVTEEDIQFTMDTHGLTREEVLSRIRGQ